MEDQNGASSQGSYDSTLEAMAKFDFKDEESIVRTITFDSSDTENDESESLNPTAAEETLHNTDILKDSINAQINVNLLYKNSQLKDTGQNKSEALKESCTVNNQTSTNINRVQSFHNLHCISETLEHTETDTSKRRHESPNLQEQDSEPKKQKTNLPRTKITAKRPVKKFPGKMASMKNMHRASEKNQPETVEESSENSDTNRLAINSGRIRTESDQQIMAALKTVAENLIQICPHLNRFARANKLHSNEFRNASAAFNNAKYHFFSLSYSAVASTIFPYRNDPKFMRIFYDLTLQLAKQKQMPYTFNEQNLQTLCSEMIEWTKMRMLQSNNDEIRRIQTSNHTTLTDTNPIDALGTFTSNNTYYTSHTSTANKTDGDITLVFPAEHMNSAIEISYNPALTSQLAAPSDSCTNVTSNITAHKNINASKYPGQPFSQPQRFVQYVQQTPGVYKQFQKDVNCNNQQGLQQRLQPLPMPHLQPLSLPANVIQQNPLSNIRIDSCYQVQSSPQNRNFPGSNIPNRSEQYHSSPVQYPQTDMSSQRALDFGHQQLNQLDQSETQQRNYIRTNNYPQERSTSRDSGFFSPVQDAYQQDCLISSPAGVTPSPPGLPPPPPYPCNAYHQQQQQQPREAKTNSNSFTMLPTFGSCIVCKNSTNLMCLGCSNIYYCGQTCQNVDWKFHAKDCKRNT